MSSFLAFGEILFDVFSDNQTLGGAPLNVTYHMSQLGSQAQIISALGNDRLGNMAMNLMGQKGISTSSVAMLEDKPTGIAMVSGTEAEADYQFNEDCAWDAIPLPRMLDNADCLYFGTLAQRSLPNRIVLRQLLSSLRCRQVFYDINIRKNFWSKEIIESSLRASTILKMNESELILVSSLLDVNNPMDLLERYDLEYIIVTRGAEGASLYSESRILHQAVISSCVVDTVGAGDSLSAGFIASLLNDGDEEKALYAGALLASYTVSHTGATPLYSDEFLALLEKEKIIR